MWSRKCFLFLFKKYVRIVLLRTLGNFLVISAIFIVARLFFNPVREEINFYLNKLNHKIYQVATPTPFRSSFAKTSSTFTVDRHNQQVEILIPKNQEFSLVIPKIGANEAVVANVDPGDEQQYREVLRHSIAHAKGTSFPGDNKHIFLFAHSTDYSWDTGVYNAVFYLLYKLEPRDDIYIFYKNRAYHYKVTGKEIVNQDQVNYMYRKVDTEFLTLQTCWPPGTSLQRLLVFAKLQQD